MRLRWLISLFWCFVVCSCNNPHDVEPIITIPDGSKSSTTFYLLNEGNFGNGVGSISQVESTDTSFRVSNNYFYSINDRWLGNVVQSMYQIGEEYWVVINNSQKIVRVNNQMTYQGELTGFNSPRYLAQNETHVFVSDLYEDSLSVISKNTFSVEKKIYTGSWNEEILVIGDELWVTQTDENKIVILDTETYQQTTAIEIVQEPFAIQEDQSGFVWVLCNGGLLSNADDPYLFKINAESKEKVDSIDLSGVDGLPSRLVVDGDTPYVISKDVWKYENGELVKVLAANGRNFYNFALTEEYIYLTDAKDFVSSGELIRYNRTSLQEETLTVGVIPSFVFLP